MVRERRRASGQARHRRRSARSRSGTLPLGLQQLVEIARVLFSGARIIILDEPTSALSPPEVERLFAILRRVRDDGHSLIFISHFLDDVLRVSDTRDDLPQRPADRDGARGAHRQAAGSSSA